MSIVLTDEMLRISATKLAEARIAAQPSLDDLDHKYSPQFEQAMEKLLKWNRRKSAWRKVTTAAAFFLIVLLIGAGMFFTFNQNVRASFVTWLRKQYENSIIYHFWGGRDTSEFPVYQIGWLPKGFELLQEIEEESNYIAFYQSDDGADQIIFSYSYGENWNNLIIDGDASIAEYLTIQGFLGEYIPYEDGHAGDLIWINESKQIVFTLSSTLGKDEIMQVAESIVSVK